MANATFCISYIIGQITMKRFAMIVAVIAAFASMAAAQKASTAPKAVPAADVKAAFERLVEGIRHADVDQVMNVYDKSDRTLFFNNNGSVTMGWETMRTNRESAYKKAADVSLEITGLRVEMLGPASAYVSCKWKQQQVYEGKPEEASGRMTLVFKKIGKEWKVVHLHTSPDNPSPTRPVLDSERSN